MRLYLLVLLANLSFLNASGPTLFPTFFPTQAPSFSQQPTTSSAPSEAPTIKPTRSPTIKPTRVPTVQPSQAPTNGPTVKPTVVPTIVPTQKPTVVPTIRPTVQPSEVPTVEPSHHPTISGPGWLLESYYTNDSSSDPLVVYGLRTQQCLAFYSGDGEMYYKSSCGQDYIQFQVYSDSECTNAIHEAEVSTDFIYEGNPYFAVWSSESYYAYSYLPGVNYVTLQCVDNGGQYEFAEDLKYAVTEFFPVDATARDDEFYQCHTDYTQFAAYQKGYCFQVDYENSFSNHFTQYFKFSPSDTSYISLTSFEEPTCSFDTSSWNYWVENIFVVDVCETNMYQGAFYYDGQTKKEKKQEVSQIKSDAAAPVADAKDAKMKHVHTNAFKFDKATPTLMRKLMTESYAKAQNKVVASLPDALTTRATARAATRAAATTTAGAKKTAGVADGFDDDALPEKAQIYFFDDDVHSYSHWHDDDDSLRMDDDEYYNYFLPTPEDFDHLSQFFLWKNVPDLGTTNPPAEWLTEIIYNSDDVPMVVNTRQTLTCMPFTKYGGVIFNYKVMCERGFVHVMYYGPYDVTCESDYRIASMHETDGFFDDDGSIGNYRYYWDFDYNEVFCSNTMFSEEFAAAVADNTYATEVFYPVTAYNDDDDSFVSECTTSENDAILGVAIIEDYCFNLETWYRSEGYNIDKMVSVKYWVDEEDNNQNIQFSIWESANCRDKFVHQTKEVEINTCYAYQPNTWYNDRDDDDEDRRRLTTDRQSEVEKARAAKERTVGNFVNHNTMGTPFSAQLEAMAPKRMIAKAKKAHAKKAHTEKKQATAAAPAAAAAAKKDVQSEYYSYYYSDDAVTTLNNRWVPMKNQWFSIPTTPTIPPSEVPTVAPSQPPTLHPSEAPSVQPSQAPSLVPTIAPTMAPNPPTLRPTPKWGNPTASPTHQVTYSFSVTQTLNGINSTIWNSDPHNAVAFAKAVAMAVPPLTADNVVIAGVTDTVVETRKLRGLAGSEEEAIDILYSLTYTVAETGYTDAETAYEALTSSLHTAIVDTDLFDGYISVVAAADSENAPDLLGTTTNSFSATDADQVGTDDDSKPDTKYHNKILVGVLVGLGGGLLVIIMIACCIFGPLSTRKNVTA